MTSLQMEITFYDFKRHYEKHRAEIHKATERVLSSGHYILGKEVAAFEKEFSAYCGTSFGIGVGSGTEALHIALLSAGVGKGDEVITVANAGVPTVAAIELSGAMPVFVDIDERSYTIDPSKIEEKVTSRTKAIIPIHLYGQCADMAPILKIAKKRAFTVIEDACQAHGALFRRQRAGSIGDIGCFSFYPTKNLGTFGDGGMIVTSNEEFARRARMIREYGQSKRYTHELKGLNSRLDEFHAAILRIKLKHLDEWNMRRRALANLYDKNIKNELIVKPQGMEYGTHIYHLYVVACDERDALKAHLGKAGIQGLVHYPTPVYLQKAYRDLAGNMPMTERCCASVLSLPLYPELTEREGLAVAAVVNDFKR
jgi:dTDP-4-amino-4,6-dideoxygalactose transaminase